MWPQAPDHQYKILFFGRSETGKSNSLSNLIYEWWDIDKIYFYVKDLQERKNEYLKSKKKEVGIKHFNTPNAFI